MLKADVEVDRRDFFVCPVIAVEPGDRLALFGTCAAGNTTPLETMAGRSEPAGRLVFSWPAPWPPGRLGERPGPDGSELAVTVVGPPVSGRDGIALAGTMVGGLPGEGQPRWRVHDGPTP
jgi:hypothetical protein